MVDGLNCVGRRNRHYKVVAARAQLARAERTGEALPHRANSLPAELKGLLPSVKPPGLARRTGSSEAARSGLERLQGLFKQGLVSADVYDKKQAELVDLAVMGSPEVPAAAAAAAEEEEEQRQQASWTGGRTSSAKQKLFTGPAPTSSIEAMRERLLMKIFDPVQPWLSGHLRTSPRLP